MLFRLIRHAARVIQANKREKEKREKRSSHWHIVEHNFLAMPAHSKCEACGGEKRLQVHHKKPFHLHPELELDPKNLITLCMGKHECHIRIGHGDSFEFYNPNVETDAAEVLKYPERREKIEASAKAGRLVNHGGS